MKKNCRINYHFNLYHQGEKKVYLPDKELVNKLNETQNEFYYLEDFFSRIQRYDDCFLIRK